MAYALAQSTSLTSSVTVRTIAFANANGPGSLLTLEIGTASSGGAASVVDSAGNNWVRAARAVNNGNFSAAEQWYAVNAVQSTNTITVNTLDPGVFHYYSLQEWSNASTAAVVAGGSTQTAQASTYDYGPVTYPNSNAVSILTFATLTAYDITVNPSGYTQLQAPLNRLQTWYRVLTSSGTESASLNSSAAEQAAFTMTIFGDPDAGGGGGTVSRRPRGLTLRGVS